MKTTHVALLGGLALSLGLTACGGSGPAAKPSHSASASPSATTSVAPAAAFTPTYAAVANDINTYLRSVGNTGTYSDTTAKVDDALGQICTAADGQDPSATFRHNIVAQMADGNDLVDQKLATGMFDATVASCRANGFAAKPFVFNATDYQDSDVMTALHTAGFDDFISESEDPDTSVGDSCDTISGKKPGGGTEVTERQAWIDTLVGGKSDLYNWTSWDRATKFVDTLFAACRSTGRSKPYVAPVPTIDEGVWTVGRDVPAGTYRSDGDLNDCYWAITRTGSNGDNIIANDLPTGGYPSVTLRAGQDFDTEGCGTWKKIG